MSSTTDLEFPLEAIFGAEGASLEASASATLENEARIALVTEFLLARAPRPDPDAARVAQIVEIIRSEPSIVRVDALSTRAGVSMRALQRLFADYVGVPVKWVMGRVRAQQGAERVAERAAPNDYGKTPPWSEVAQELGYADQAHFIRDFKAQIGATPGAFAAACEPSETKKESALVAKRASKTRDEAVRRRRAK